MEEYVARRLDAQDYFFMWQVEPTVIFGRNQLIENEVNLDYCKAHGINTYRRKSGGGCVYADMDNIMFSYITPDDNVNLTFARYIDMVVQTLRKLGIDASASGRNDVMIGERKVSGNAFYHIPGRSIVHGTMLYSTDMKNMVGAITPNDAKLLSKGIQSVRQHVTTLKEHITMDIEDFKLFVRENICDSEITLDAQAIAHIEEIEKEYLTTEFIYGNNPRYNITKRGRIEGTGDFEIRLEMKNDVIKDINVMGDFFLVGDIGKGIVNALKNRRLDRETIDKALPDRLDDIILNLKREDFIELLTK